MANRTLVVGVVVALAVFALVCAGGAWLAVDTVRDSRDLEVRRARVTEAAQALETALRFDAPSIVSVEAVVRDHGAAFESAAREARAEYAILLVSPKRPARVLVEGALPADERGRLDAEARELTGSGSMSTARGSLWSGMETRHRGIEIGGETHVVAIGWRVPR